MKYKNKRRLIIGLSILLLILFYIFKNTFFLFKVMGIIFGLWVFYFFDHAFNIKFKHIHYIIISIILFCGIILSPFYWVYPNYDKFLHLVMPILASLIVFYVTKKLDIDFKWRILLTLTSVITLLTLLEVGEYLFDLFWDLKTQGVYIRDVSGLEKYDLVLDRNDDTMIDLMLGIGGTLLYSITHISRYYLDKKYKKKVKK